MGKPKKILRILQNLLGFFYLFFLGSCIYFGYQINYGKDAGRSANVTDVPLAEREIPGEARDINYWLAYGLSGYRYYDCELSLSEFEAFARERRWELKPVTEEITVCNPFDRASPIRITSGRYFRYTQLNNGGMLAVFDAKKGRLYYSASAR